MDYKQNMCLLIINYAPEHLYTTRPRPMSRKTSVKGGEKSSLFELRRLEIGGVSFDDFSLLHVSF